MDYEFDSNFYDFDLPKELIAQLPSEKRSESKLFFYKRSTQEIKHLKFKDIVEILDNKYCIVLNNTKVEKRKIICKKPTGKEVPILITQYKDNFLKCIPYKSIKINQKLILPQNIECIVVDKDYQTQEIVLEGIFQKEKIKYLIDKYGLSPLPPYIKRKQRILELNEIDKERYQTVYAEKEGSLAAPTAGFHFDREILSKLIEKGIEILYITLNIGISTFKPIKTKSILGHKIFPEYAEVSKDTAQKINKLISDGKKILCVGTTVVRTLEFLMTKYDKIIPYSGDVDIYIYPGYEFKITSGLITNFHLPKSTNLVLVCAFAGREKVLNLYKIAIENQYRFYSYGDAMLIL
ncbi:MAG: tRNA preQ1(34) S-adenosylmethionine ribosyltransferase-isomerase QueA [Endomicrobiia bacterium]